MSDSLPITYDEMKGFVLQVLDKGIQVNDWYREVATLVRQQQPTLLPQMQQQPTNIYGGMSQPGVGPAIRFDPNMDSNGLMPTDRSRIQSIYWDLVVERIIHVGQGVGGNDAPPFYHLTEFGKKHVQGQPATPFDQDGYLRRIREITPPVDDVTLEYLKEALHTFRVSCLLSSTITLGCAAERLLLNLMDALLVAVPETDGRKLKDTANRPIMQRMKPFDDLMRNRVRPKLKDLDKLLEDNLDVTFIGIAHSIRQSRNGAGHPTGTTVDRDVIYSQMMMFPTYTLTVQSLIAWLRQNTALLVTASNQGS